MISKKNILSILKNLVFSAIILIILLSSLINIYESRNKLISKFSTLFSKNIVENENNDSSKDKIWSEKIMQGGYILFLRHAERDKKKDVSMYDNLDVKINNSNDIIISNQIYSGATCLNKQGVIQAKIFGKYVKDLKLPIAKVISSPSCRARQTAELIYDSDVEINKLLIYKGLYQATETEKKRIKNLKNFLLNLVVPHNSNILLSSHNNVINSKIFDNIDNSQDLKTGEGGFYVISILENKLILEHNFTTFPKFLKNFYTR